MWAFMGDPSAWEFFLPWAYLLKGLEEARCGYQLDCIWRVGNS